MVIIAVTMLTAACGRTDGIDAQDGATITVSSNAMTDGEDIPVEFTCDGEDVPPDVAWADIPADTVEIMVVVDDPDAPSGTFTHWTVWGLEPDASPLDADLPAGAVEGTNDFGDVGYRGPCPPEGDDPHHYRFRVLALDSSLDLPEGAALSELTAAIDDRVIGQGQLQATYAR
jgi:Raf kinase inhibitor-like YbhB/YbcL family protein